MVGPKRLKKPVVSAMAWCALVATGGLNGEDFQPKTTPDKAKYVPKTPKVPKAPLVPKAPKVTKVTKEKKEPKPKFLPCKVCGNPRSAKAVSGLCRTHYNYYFSMTDETRDKHANGEVFLKIKERKELAKKRFKAAVAARQAKEAMKPKVIRTHCSKCGEPKVGTHTNWCNVCMASYAKARRKAIAEGTW